MSLQGNLSTVSLSDVFQLLNRGRSSGVLKIQTPEGTRMIEMENGQIVAVANSINTIRLGDLLRARNIINEKQLTQALMHQKIHDIKLGEAVVQLGLITAEDLREILLFQLQEEVFDLFMMEEGDFEFDTGETIPENSKVAGGFSGIAINPDSLLLESAKRADEWKSILTRIPSSASLFTVTDVGREYYRTADSEFQVVMTLINEERTFESCVQKSCFGRFRTGQIITELLNIGAIQHLPFDQFVAVADRHLQQNRPDEAQRIYKYALDYLPDPEQRRHVGAQLKRADETLKTMQWMGEENRTEIVRMPGMTFQRDLNWPIIISTVAVLLFSIAGLIVYLATPSESDEDGQTTTASPPAPIEKKQKAVHNKSPSGTKTPPLKLTDTSITKTFQLAAGCLSKRMNAQPETGHAPEYLVSLSASYVALLKMSSSGLPDPAQKFVHDTRSRLNAKLSSVYNTTYMTLANDINSLNETFQGAVFPSSDHMASAAAMLKRIAHMDSVLPPSELKLRLSQDTFDSYSGARQLLMAYNAYFLRAIAGKAGTDNYPTGFNDYINTLKSVPAEPAVSWLDASRFRAIVAQLEARQVDYRNTLATIQKKEKQKRFLECLSDAAGLLASARANGMLDCPVKDEHGQDTTLVTALNGIISACTAEYAREKRQVAELMSYSFSGSDKEKKRLLSTADTLLNNYRKKTGTHTPALFPDDYLPATPFLARVYYFRQALQTR